MALDGIFMRSNYQKVRITSSNLRVEALIPEEFTENITSQYDTVFPDGAGETAQKAFAMTGVMGGSAKFDTPQKWMSTEMREFELELHFVAVSNARAEVFIPAKSVLALAAPGGDWRVIGVNRQHLTAPPTCILNVGKVVQNVEGYIQNATIQWKPPVDANGYCMYAIVQCTFVEQVTPKAYDVMPNEARSGGGGKGTKRNLASPQ